MIYRRSKRSSPNGNSERRSIGYEESDIDTLAAASPQGNFNAIVLEVYRGWTDNPAIVNEDVNGSQNASANLEDYLCQSPQTCGGGLTDCSCPDKLHPFENKGSDKARIVPAYWQSMDVRLKKFVLATTSGRKSLTAAIKLGQNTCVGGTQGFGSSSGLPHNNYKHFLLYLIGRYGAYNVLWMGHQEADELDCHSTDYISAYLDWMHTNDPYFRPTSNHKTAHTAAPAFNAYTNHDAWSTGPISPRFLAVQETDSFGSAGNLDEAGPDDTAAWDHARSASWGTNIPGLTGNPKPWVNMEYGFERRASDDDRNQADQVDLDLLEDIWGAMLGRAAGMFYGSPWIKPGNRSSVDTGRLNDPGFKYYHPNLYKFFHDADANVRYWEWNAFKKVPVGATAYTLSCKQNDSCVLNFLETNAQNIDVTAKGLDDPAFASGSTVHLRWYDVRRGCWEDTGTTSFIAGSANHVIRPGDPVGGSDRWVAVMRKDTPYGTLSATCSDVPGPVPPPTPPPPPPLPPPLAEATPVHRDPRLRCTGSACRVRIECLVIEGSGTACSNRIDVFVRASAVRDGARAKAPKRIRFATGVAGLEAGATAEVKLRLTKRGRRWLRTGRKLRGGMEIRNAAGTDIVSSTRVTIRHKRR